MKLNAFETVAGSALSMALAASLGFVAVGCREDEPARPRDSGTTTMTDGGPVTMTDGGPVTMTDGGPGIDSGPGIDGGPVTDGGGGTDAGPRLDSGVPLAGDHLMISELGAEPNTNEFLEIWNPTASPIDLSDYYLSDNSSYTSIAAGTAWTPVSTHPETDFLARFPAGLMIGANEYLVIALNDGFESVHGGCPDLVANDTETPVDCGGGSVPAMRIPTNGGVAALTTGGRLSNDREMVVLFTWNGTVGDPLEDADYLTWGTAFEDGSRADKSAVSGYSADTAPAIQMPAPAPDYAAPDGYRSIERCSGEVGETTSGGNGIGGHDETSENLGVSFVVATTPTPGAANGCL